MFVAFAMVRVLIDKLSPDVYGIWLTLSSFLGMFSFFNIGMGNGMKNLLFSSIAAGNPKESKEIVSTTYICLGVIVTLLIIISIGLFPLFNWSDILNAPQEMSGQLCFLAIVVFSSLMLQLESGLIVSALQAYQETAYGDLINVIGQCLSLFAVIVIPYCFFRPGLVYYGVAIAVIPVLISLIYNIYLFSTRLKDIRPDFHNYNPVYTKELLALGGKFFVIQIAALIMYQSNNLIIAHIAGNEQVTVFNVAYKYCGILQMIFTLMLVPTWSAAGDAYVKGEFDWIKNTFRKLNQVWLLFLGLSVVQCVISPFVYRIWIGDSVSVSIYVTIFSLLYFILSMRAGVYCNIINGTGKIKLQYVMYIIQAILYIPLAIFAGIGYGICGVLGAMCVIQCINIIWMSRQYNLIVDGKATGIWNK